MVEQISQTTNVSIHAPAWGATSDIDHKPTDFDRFNPRARMGRDILTASEQFTTNVSIHAPAWGATAERFYDDADNWVSIHAPAWGATSRYCGKKKA